MNSPEDLLIERKSKGVSTEDICKTLVAFANSTPEDREGVLFIGIADNGVVSGVDDPDGLQKSIRRISETKCYPKVYVQCRVLSVNGMSVVAAVVPFSRDRPHFAGPAYVRKGSESVTASAEMLEELITSRNDIARKLLEYRDNETEVLLDLPSPYSVKERMRFRCKVKACNPHFATLSEQNGTIHSVNLANVGLKWEGQMSMPLITEYRR
jgi:hypothetical protein